MFMLHYPTSPARSMRLLTALGLAFATLTSSAQLIIDTTQVPNTLVGETLLGLGVSFNNVMFNDQPGSSFPIEVDRRIAHFNATNANVGLTAGIVLHTGDVSYLPGPNDVEVVTAGGGSISTPDLDLCMIAGGANCGQSGGGVSVFNKATLEFDLVPENDMLSFRYVFSSEEYERWTCMGFNDSFGFLLSGPGVSGPFENDAMNIAFIPGSLANVSVNTVNSGMTPNNANGSLFNPFEGCLALDSNFAQNTPYYVYNGSGIAGLLGGPQTEEPYCCDPYYIQHNGLTVALTASAAVQLGQTYHIKMALANVGDWRVPSAVFLEQQSFRASDRFTLSMDEGPNVDLSGLIPVLHESHTDSVYLRFNRWGGFYLDEHLQLSVQGNAVAGVDYLPALPDSIHFNQLDSAAVIALALPVHADTTRELLIDLISSNGDKVMSYTLIIDKEIRDNTGLAERSAEAPIPFPNPTDGTLHVVLPGSVTGTTDLHILDLAGRVVLQHRMNGSPRTTLDVSSLPNGLYVLKTMTEGRAGAARFHVRH